MVGIAKGKSIRNKARRVLLIQGQPDYLYKESVVKSVEVTVRNKTYKLGAISLDFVDDLKTIPDGNVKIFTKTNRNTRGIEGFAGLHIRKSNSNTTIEVAAPTEELLQQKINILTIHLLEYNLDITERCAWACTVNIKEKIITPANATMTSMPTKVDDLLDLSDTNNSIASPKTDTTKLSAKTIELQKLAHKMGALGKITNSKGLNNEYNH